MKDDYDNIMSLAKTHNYKKIVVIRNSWSDGNYCIVDKVILKPDGKYGYAYGRTNYRNGYSTSGSIPCAGTYAWKVVKALEENLEVERIE